jgi:hypothetical protein
MERCSLDHIRIQTCRTKGMERLGCGPKARRNWSLHTVWKMMLGFGQYAPWGCPRDLICRWLERKEDLQTHHQCATYRQIFSTTSDDYNTFGEYGIADGHFTWANTSISTSSFTAVGTLHNYYNFESDLNLGPSELS